MSIENEAKRIADALEIIVGWLGNEREKEAATRKLDPAGKPAKRTEDVVPGDDAIPGSDAVPGEDVIPGVEDVTPVMGVVGIKTSAELRDFVQKFLAKASELDEKDKGTRSQLFVKYIREVVCAKFSPKEPKLLKIPEKEVGKAAQMVYDYATKNSILI